MSESEILSDYPELTSDDIRAALQFAYQLKDKTTRVFASESGANVFSAAGHE